MVPELTVSDFAESLAFYTQGVGFAVAFSRTEPAFAYLDFEGAQLMISEFHQDGWNVAGLTRPYGRGINLQIECSDVEGLTGGSRALVVPPLPRDRGGMVRDRRRALGPARVPGAGP